VEFGHQTQNKIFRRPPKKVVNIIKRNQFDSHSTPSHDKIILRPHSKRQNVFINISLFKLEAYLTFFDIFDIQRVAMPKDSTCCNASCGILIEQSIDMKIMLSQKVANLPNNLLCIMTEPRKKRAFADCRQI
jgi:hypothetical protein